MSATVAVTTAHSNMVMGGLEKNSRSSPAACTTDVGKQRRRKTKSSRRRKQLSQQHVNTAVKKKVDEVERIALVLDMDECLVHSKFIGDMSTYRQEEAGRPEDVNLFDDCFEIFMDDGEKAVVNKRPGLDEFLLEASKRFDLYVFTAGLQIYGQPVIDVLDPHKKIFKKTFFRDSCEAKGGLFLKDLTVVRKDLSRVVLVDNNPVSFLPQPSNGIPVPSFYDDPEDKTLRALSKVLMNIHELDDVRPRLHQMFRLGDLLAEHRTAIMAA